MTKKVLTVAPVWIGGGSTIVYNMRGCHLSVPMHYIAANGLLGRTTFKRSRHHRTIYGYLQKTRKVRLAIWEPRRHPRERHRPLPPKADARTQ